MESNLGLDVLRRAALHGILMPRAEAMFLLAAASEPEGVTTLSSILETDPDKYARIAAAAALGRVHGSNSEDQLLRLVLREEPVVQKQIFASLARVGTPRALFAADAAAEYPDEQVADAARFAATVIAHRYNIPGHDWLTAHEEKGMQLAEKNARSAAIERVSPSEQRGLASALQSEPFGLEYSRLRSVILECAGKAQIVTLSAESVPSAALLERKFVAGAVLTKNIETEQYSISHVILSSSNGSGGVRILAPRTSGRGGLVGTGRMENGRLRFELRSLPRPGAAAISVTGILEDSELKLNVLSGRERMGARVPAAG